MFSRFWLALFKFLKSAEMLARTMNVKINDEETLNVSIFRTQLNNQEVYFARYINIELKYYKDLSIEAQGTEYGMKYTEYTNGPTVYYSNLKDFINDLPAALRNEPRLKTKI